MNKKSQIAVFILFGAVFLIGVVFASYLKNSSVNEEGIEKINKIVFDINPLKSYIKNCIDITAKNALVYIGKHSGYYQLKKPYLNDSNFNLSYYFFNNIDFSPSLNHIEKEISNYIDNNLQICLKNFEEFKEQGLNISSHLHSNVKIGANSLSINIDSPITISRGKSVQKIDNINTFIEKVNLYSIYNVSKEITILQYKEPNNLCLSCLYDLGEKNNLYVDITEYLNSTLIFDIRDYNSSIARIYNFTFAVKYPEVSCENLAGFDDFIFLNECLEAEKEKLSNRISIENIANFNIKVGELFFYDINAAGKNIFFEDFTDLFEIDKVSGIINFTPIDEHIGSHQIWIKVYDLAGNEDYANFKINITK